MADTKPAVQCFFGHHMLPGDRLFVSLLGSGFIHLGWLFFGGTDLWWALGLSIVFAVAVFRWV